ncbi:porin [Burkholderia cenocepacia]|uniref:porin n=1 Tax=Burkholderia cenocepacia TaxID=95486 RepID=UPI00190300D9|nr:porin [Burkholderia cenocepacia]MBJ9698549.1 porin [Burkholderia cenocepacia]
MSFKPPLKAAPLALLLTCSAPIFAQSSVTLYGIIDSGITYLSNVGGKSAWREAGGVNVPNRWGLRGSEDLGNGLKAVFRLEGGFNSTTGALQSATQEFNRFATVGLQDDRYGTVVLGRQPDFMIRLLPVTGILGPIYAYHPGDYDRISGEYLSNTVSYETPRYGGFHAGAMYSFGSTTAPASNTGRGISFVVDYQDGPITAVAAMTDLNGVNINPANVGLSYAFGRNLAPTQTAGINLNNLATYGAGISYKVGKWRASAEYSRTVLRAFAMTERLQSGDVALFYSVTPSLILSGNYVHSIGLGGCWDTGAAMADYFLSKRTDVYLTGVYQYVGSAGQHAALLFQTASSTESQTAVRVGITHRF